jgi:hypothetical protein
MAVREVERTDFQAPFALSMVICDAVHLYPSTGTAGSQRQSADNDLISLDQSNARTRSPMSPPPLRKQMASASALRILAVLLFGPPQRNVTDTRGSFERTILILFFRRFRHSARSQPPPFGTQFQCACPLRRTASRL